MSEFINIVRHKNRLRAACKSLSIDQLQTIIEQLTEFIAKRREKEAAAQAELAKQAAKKQEIVNAIMAAGLSLDDFISFENSDKAKSTRKPVAPQYRITDKQGKIHEWTGRGRTPKAFQAYFDQGGTRDDCRI